MGRSRDTSAKYQSGQRRRVRRKDRRWGIETLEPRLPFAGFDWSFDEGPPSAILQDNSGNGQHLALVAADMSTAWDSCPATSDPDNRFALRINERTYANGSPLTTDEVETLAFWIKPSSEITASSDPSAILDLHEGSLINTIGFGSWTGSLTNESITLIDEREGHNGIRATAVTNQSFAKDVWTHIAFVWNDAQNHYDIYVNGEVAPTVPNSNGHAHKLHSPDRMLVGRRRVSVDPLVFPGAVDELVLDDVSWTAEEVRQVAEMHSGPCIGAVPLLYQAPPDTAIPISLKVRDYASTSVQFQIVQVPSHGSLVAGETSQFLTYHAAPGFSGQDEFSYRAVDGEIVGTEVPVVIIIANNDEPTLSHFVPGLKEVGETVGFSYGNLPNRTFQGSSLPFDLIVDQQGGQNIERFDSAGQLVWRTSDPYGYRSAEVFGDEVVYPSKNLIQFLRVTTGDLLRSWEIGDESTSIEFVNQLDADHFLVIAANPQLQTRLELWSRSDGKLWTFPHPIVYPRWADKFGNIVAVADTFQHRVMGVDITSNALVFNLDVFYPGDVRFLAQDKIMITEEHGDRVWTYNLQTGEKQLIFSAPGPTTDLSLSLAQLMELASSVQQRIDPADDTSKSKSSVDYSGRSTLYSPNSSVQLPDGSYYIADTDNHRVVHVSPLGELLAEVGGFNNPTMVSFVDPAVQDAASITLPSDPLVQVDLSVTDSNGNPISTLLVGDEFDLRVSVRDLRSIPRGVFAAYLDINYLSERADVAGPIQFGDDYLHSPSGSTEFDGLIDEVGSHADFGTLDGQPHHLFTVRLRAETPGELLFSSDAADLLAYHDTLLFGEGSPIPVNAIQFGTTAVAVLPGDVSAIDDEFEVSEDSGETSLAVLLNDQIGESTEIISVEQPQHGTAVVGADGRQIIYTPDPNFFGDDEFTYQLRHTSSPTSTGQVRIHVTPVNDPPIAMPDEITVFNGNGRALLPTLANDSTLPDSGESPFVAYVTQPLQGGHVGVENGQVVFFPTAGFYGDVVFTYFISDAHGGSASAIVTVHVHKQWHSPILAMDVNRDGIISPIDVLLLVNFLNTFGSGPISNVPSDERASAAMVDANDDGFVTPADALLIINELDRIAAGIQ